MPYRNLAKWFVKFWIDWNQKTVINSLPKGEMCNGAALSHQAVSTMILSVTPFECFCSYAAFFRSGDLNRKHHEEGFMNDLIKTKESKRNEEDVYSAGFAGHGMWLYVC